MKSAVCKRMRIYIAGELTIGPRDPLRGSTPATTPATEGPLLMRGGGE